MFKSLSTLLAIALVPLSASGQAAFWSDCPASTSAPTSAPLVSNIPSRVDPLGIPDLRTDPRVSDLYKKVFIQKGDVEEDFAKFNNDLRKNGKKRHTTPSSKITGDEWSTGGGSPEGSDGQPSFKCAHVPVPISRATQAEAETGRRISIFVKGMVDIAGAGVNSTQSRTADAVVLLQGGPGGSSDSLEPLMDALFKATRAKDDVSKGERNDNDVGNNGSGRPRPFDTFVLDHRGVGRSHRLGCSLPQAETPGSPLGVQIDPTVEVPLCDEARIRGDPEYDDLSSFSSFEAAADLADVIDAIKAEFGYERVAIYGVSYGTMWATRFLQQFPDKASAVFMDGTVSTKGGDCVGPGCRLTIDRWDEVFSIVGRKFIEGCAADEACSKHMKITPSSPSLARYLPTVLGKVCPEIEALFPGQSIIERVSKSLMVLEARAMIPLIVYRIARCSEFDVNAIERILAKFPDQPESQCAPLSSSVLQWNIVYPELWAGPQPPSSRESLGWYTGLPLEMETIFKHWTRYPVLTGPYERYFNSSFVTEIPVAIVNGDLDPQTPVFSAETQAQNSYASPLRLAVIPGANHGTFLNSPTHTGAPCGFQMLVSFLARPSTSDPAVHPCLDDLRPVRYTLSAEESIDILGTADPFDGDVSPPGTPSPKPLPPLGPKGRDNVRTGKWAVPVIAASAVVVVVAAMVAAYPCARRNAQGGNDGAYMGMLA